MAFNDGWLVKPDMVWRAASTISTPASDAIKHVATPFPLVSWVCKWIGAFTFSFKAFINV